MAAEMVNVATSEKLKEMDWMKNIEICELVARDQGQAKYAIKQIKKRLGSKNTNVQLFAVMLLEMLMNNCGEPIHRLVIDNSILSILVKIVKKKTDLPVRERIFLLLDATQTSLGGASGKFPQFYNAYYELVSAGVQFSQHPPVPVPELPVPKEKPKNVAAQKTLTQKYEDAERKENNQNMPDWSIIHKANSILEVLRDVLNAVDPKRPEVASDEFVLDLVEQCSFQKQRVMHLVIASRDEEVVTRAIELNEQLHMVLTQHNALLLISATSTATSFVNEDAEEEDVELLIQRLRKGKACAEDPSDVSVGSLRSVPDDKLRRSLIRPLCIQPPNPDSKPLLPPPPAPATSIPPPPAKFAERERFFKENTDHVKSLSLHSRNGSSSLSGSTGSTDFSEKDAAG